MQQNHTRAAAGEGSLLRGAGVQIATVPAGLMNWNSVASKAIIMGRKVSTTPGAQILLCRMLLQVLLLISLAKQLQQSLAAGSSSSPCQQYQQTQQGTQWAGSTSSHQVLSDMFRALAVLGELLTASPSLLLDTDAEHDSPHHSPAVAAAGGTDSYAGTNTLLKSPAAACHHSSSTAAASSPGRLKAAGAAAAVLHTASATGQCCGDMQQLTAQLQQQQARLQEVLHEKTALQQLCDDLQWQLQQKQQCGSSTCGAATGFSSSKLDDVRHLAEVVALQGQKQQLQQQVRKGQQQSRQVEQTRLCWSAGPLQCCCHGATHSRQVA
jgi:hypothetical protein